MSRSRAERRQRAGLLPPDYDPTDHARPDEFFVPAPPIARAWRGVLVFLFGLAWVALPLSALFYIFQHRDRNPAAMSGIEFLPLPIAIGLALLAAGYWMLYVEQTLRLESMQLLVHRRAGFLHWTWSVPRALVSLVAVTPDGRELVAETGDRRIVLLQDVPADTLSRVFHYLRDEADLPAAGDREPPRLPPAGWTVIEHPDGAAELVRSAGTFLPVRDLLLRAVLFALALFAPSLLASEQVILQAPAWMLGLWLADALVRVGLRLGAVRRVRVEGGRLEVVRGFPFELGRVRFEDPVLRVGWQRLRNRRLRYDLFVLQSGVSMCLESAEEFSAPAVQLGRHLAGRLERKVELPESFTHPERLEPPTGFRVRLPGFGR